MVNINLFSWREAERLYQTRELKKILSRGIGLLVVSLIVVHILLVKVQTDTARRINLLKKEMKKNSSHITYVERPQPTFNQRDSAITLFTELRKLNEMGNVCFTEIARSKHLVSFTGRTRSALDLTDYLRSWKAGYLFSEIQIKLIEQQENGLFQFVFTAIERN